MKIIDVGQRTPEWHSWRSTGISASEVAIILEESPYKTRYQLWGEATGLFEKDDLSKNPFVRMGIEFEDPVRIHIENDPTIKNILRQQLDYTDELILLPICAEYEKNEIFKASFDGLLLLNETQGIPFEIKYPHETTWNEVNVLRERSKAFKLYQWQVQHQMLVANAPFGVLAFGQYINGKMTVKYFFIRRDEVKIQKILTRGEAFHNLIQQGIPPELDMNKDTYTPRGKNATKWKEISSKMKMIEDQRRPLLEELDRLDKQRDKFRDQIEPLMDGYKKASYDGLNLTRITRQGSFDVDKFIIDTGFQFSKDDLNKYRKKASTHVKISFDEETFDPLVSKDNELKKVSYQ